MTNTTEGSEVNAGLSPDTDDPNSHLFDYIKYYRELDKPGFAVLVTGEWGSGKTHLIKEILPWEGEDKEAYYVSLFGLKNASEVDAAVYAEMYPVRSTAQEWIAGVGGALRGVSASGLNAGGVISGSANLVAAYMRKDIDSSKPIIFDDLERSSIEKPEETLGVINYYVEHKKCRIVVVAHDEKLVEKFKEAKEKIFGHTIRVEPNTKSAFDNFGKEIDEQTFGQILVFKNEIIDAFTQSGSKSLRILRHVMFDLERFFEALKKEHLENKNAMRDIVSLFSALAIASRENLLDTDNILTSHRAGKPFALRKYLNESLNELNKSKTTKNVDIKKLFGKIDLDNPALNDSVLIDMLLIGRYNNREICASLDNSAYFANPDILPPWLKVSQFDYFTDEFTDKAKKQMEIQFKERKAVKIGEMLHIFALRMMMAKHNILDCSVEDVAEESKKYIDDLLDMKQLPSPCEEDATSDFVSTAYYGYAYWIEESYRKNFKYVQQHLIKQQNIALEQKYPEIHDELINMLVNDPAKFAGTISFLQSYEHKYAWLPVMKAIDANEFVDTWLNAQNRSEVWNWTKRALEQRYDGNALHPDNGALTSETAWIKAVLEQMRKRADTETGFRKLRIERSIPKIGFPD